MLIPMDITRKHGSLPKHLIKKYQIVTFIDLTNPS
jgi:hypothetical protein